MLTAAKKTKKDFRYRFSVKDLEKMYEAGVFKPDEKVELINGEVFKLSPIGLRHAVVVDNLTRVITELIYLDEILKENYIVRVQNPIYIDKGNLPEPDLTIVHKDYLKENQHPKPKYIELLVEVSDTTYEKDTILKLPIYAKKKIKKVWIVNLNTDHIEEYTNPYKGEYLSVSIYPIDKTIKLFEKEIPVKEILKS